MPGLQLTMAVCACLSCVREYNPTTVTDCLIVGAHLLLRLCTGDWVLKRDGREV
jgi:hypothetical protein